MTLTLDLQQWRRAEVLVEQALDLSPDQRISLLDHACGADVELRAAIERLLEIDEQAAPWLSSPIARLSRSQGTEPVDPWQDRRLGAYRLVHLLGGGGMSRVYLGERADGEVEQQVAVKVLLEEENRPFRLHMLRQERHCRLSLGIVGRSSSRIRTVVLKSPALKPLAASLKRSTKRLCA